MRVVEIGCGAEAGPRFEGATEHVIVDKDPLAVGTAYMGDIRLTPVIADARDLKIEDASIDTVLARNVFGDSSLFLSNDEKNELKDELLGLHADEQYTEVAKKLMHIEAISVGMKVEIMRETARILVAGGRLVVVEQLSPPVARRFFEVGIGFSEVDGGLDLSEAFDVEQGVPLREVTPPNYAAAHDGPKTQTWVATKK